MSSSLCLATDHLSPVGHVIQTVSDNYGRYNLTCIANIDHFPGAPIDEVMEWSDKWWPRKWAGTFMIQHSSDDLYTDSRYVSVFVALLRDNEHWWDNNQDCKYVQYIKSTTNRPRQLPVVTSQKQVDKFLAASQRFLYTGEISTGT